MSNATQAPHARLSPERLGEIREFVDEQNRRVPHARNGLDCHVVAALLAELDAVTRERDDANDRAREYEAERNEAGRSAGRLASEMTAFHKRLELALGLDSESEYAPDVWGVLATLVRERTPRPSDAPAPLAADVARREIEVDDLIEQFQRDCEMVALVALAEAEAYGPSGTLSQSRKARAITRNEIRRRLLTHAQNVGVIAGGEDAPGVTLGEQR